MTETVPMTIADDHSSFQDGGRQCLGETGDRPPVAEFRRAADTPSISQFLTPDLILLNINLPGGGIGAAEAIAKAHPGIKIMLLSAADCDCAPSAPDCGALGYALKSIGGPNFMHTVQSVAKGVSYVTPAIGGRDAASEGAARPDPNALTAREEQTMDLVAKGLTNGEIAIRLKIKEKTVKSHMTTIMEKLRVRNRVEAVLKYHGRRYSAPAPS